MMQPPAAFPQAATFIYRFLNFKRYRLGVVPVIFFKAFPKWLTDDYATSIEQEK